SPARAALHACPTRRASDLEVFDEEFRLVLQRLLIQGVQDGVAGAVGSGAGAVRAAFAVLGGHAAEGALVDLAFRSPRKRHAVVRSEEHTSELQSRFDLVCR